MVAKTANINVKNFSVSTLVKDDCMTVIKQQKSLLFGPECLPSK